MEHVNIISQEAITRGLEWPPFIPAAFGIAFALAVLCVAAVRPKRFYDICMNLMLHAVACSCLMMVTMVICTAFFPVETGRYKYEGTLDSEMTIVEFEEFQQQYSNVRFEDGVWKWEDK